MAFGVNVITDILKFPSPLFPKYKNVYNTGMRQDIPPLMQAFEFPLTLDSNNKFELRSLQFSSTGYKDGDYFNLYKNNQLILNHIYTKELGQSIIFKPIVKFNPEVQDILKFEFVNGTGTSKVIWVDFDFATLKPVQTI